MIVLIAKDFNHRIRFCCCECVKMFCRKWFLGEEKTTYSSSLKVVVDNHLRLESLLHK